MDVGALHDAAKLAPRFRFDDVAPGAGAGTSVAELFSDDAEEMAPFVQQNQPVVLRGALRAWRPVALWDDTHLCASCAERRVPVRHADAPGRFGDPQRAGMYAPGAPELELGELLERLRSAEAAAEPAGVYAAQVRLRTHLPELYADTRPEPACLRALGRTWRNAPSAYVGCGAATPLHFDLLENLLVVVRGRKMVSLWHPAHSTLLYPGGGESALFSQAPDPHAADDDAFPLLAEAAPLALHTELGEGDALYLPACWWHHVRTRAGERSISVSYWASQPEAKAWQPPSTGREAWQDDEGAAGGAGADFSLR